MSVLAITEQVKRVKRSSQQHSIKTPQEYCETIEQALAAGWVEPYEGGGERSMVGGAGFMGDALITTESFDARNISIPSIDHNERNRKIPLRSTPQR